MTLNVTQGHYMTTYEYWLVFLKSFVLYRFRHAIYQPRSISVMNFECHASPAWKK